MFERLESQFHYPTAVVWSKKYWVISIYASIIYVITIFAIQRWMRDRKPYDLRRWLFGWSLMLSLFSMLGFYHTGPITIARWSEKGWHAALCKSYRTETWEEDAFLFVGSSGLWTWMFMLSKLVELGDTIFIVLRKQKLIFLHWYHHITVMTYAWYFYAYTHTIGGWYTWMNYLVHSFMYSYYTLCASGYGRPPKMVNILITLLQLLQMVGGLIINLYVLYNIYFTPGFYCDGVAEASYSPCGWGSAMYGSYFILFVHFFYVTYVKGRPPKVEKERSPDRDKSSLQTASNGNVCNHK